MAENPAEEKKPDEFTEKIIQTPDDIINELGGCGRFQLRMSLLVHVMKTICSWSAISLVFVTAVPNWRCAESVGGSYTNDNATGSENRSADKSCLNILGEKCKRFEFDTGMRTIVSEWSLVCDHDWIPPMIVTAHMVVTTVGFIFAGHFADIFGRKVPFFFSIFLMMVFHLVSYFSVSWVMFLVVRMMIGVGVAFFLTIQYSYLSEFSLSRWRSWFIGFPSWPIQGCILALILWLMKDWKNVQLVIAAIGVPFMAAWWFMPESFRWYYSHDRVEDAEKVIITVSKVNRRPVPDMTYMKQVATNFETQQTDRKYSLLDLLKSKFLIKVTILLSFNWMVIGLADTGILYGVQNLSGNFYLNLFLYKVVQIPAKSLGIWLQNRFGRRNTSILVYLVTGAAALIVGIVQYVDTDKRDALILAFAMTANLGSATAWGPLQTITIELYPTVIRNIGFSFCAVLAQIAAAVAPPIVHLDTSIPGILYFLCGGLSLVAGIAFCWIPETNDENLSDKLSENRTVIHFIDNVTMVTDGIDLGHDEKKPEKANHDNNINGSVNLSSAKQKLQQTTF